MCLYTPEFVTHNFWRSLGTNTLNKLCIQWKGTIEENKAKWSVTALCNLHWFHSWWQMLSATANLHSFNYKNYTTYSQRIQHGYQQALPLTMHSNLVVQKRNRSKKCHTKKLKLSKFPVNSQFSLWRSLFLVSADIRDRTLDQCIWLWLNWKCVEFYAVTGRNAVMFRR